VAAATLACGSLILLLPAVVTWPTSASQASALAWGAAIMLGVLCSGIAYALYFRLIGRIGPARAATVTYLVPLFGVAWGWAVLSEPLVPSMAIAGALIIGGVACSHRRTAPTAPVVVQQAASAMPTCHHDAIAHAARRAPCAATP
jgi:drug/metabolite transporter (DMT)-like permease